MPLTVDTAGARSNNNAEVHSEPQPPPTPENATRIQEGTPDPQTPTSKRLSQKLAEITAGLSEEDLQELDMERVRCGDDGSSVLRWTSAEDNLLRKAVKRLGPHKWGVIASEYLGGSRTDVQCLYRWQKVLRPGLVKGPWTKEEDDTIIRCREAGIVKWSEIASHVKGRIGKQCRERWFNHLDPNIKHGEWTEEEDKKLFDGQALLGNKWSQIAKLFLPGRPENAVKNRWNAATRRRRSNNKRNKETGSVIKRTRPAGPRHYTMTKVQKRFKQMRPDYSAAQPQPSSGNAAMEGMLTLATLAGATAITPMGGASSAANQSMRELTEAAARFHAQDESSHAAAVKLSALLNPAEKSQQSEQPAVGNAVGNAAAQRAWLVSRPASIDTSALGAPGPAHSNAVPDAAAGTSKGQRPTPTNDPVTIITSLPLLITPTHMSTTTSSAAADVTRGAGVPRNNDNVRNLSTCHQKTAVSPASCAGKKSMLAEFKGRSMQFADSDGQSADGGPKRSHSDNDDTVTTLAALHFLASGTTRDARARFESSSLPDSTAAPTASTTSAPAAATSTFSSSASLTVSTSSASPSIAARGMVTVNR